MERQGPDKGDEPRLLPVSLDISALRCQCHAWHVPKTQAVAGLIVFTGTFRLGSAGRDDARFIAWRINELADLRMPARIAGLLVDLRGLDYQWGDDLGIWPLSLPDTAPVLALVRPEQIAPLKGVLGDECLRVDARAAFAEISDRIRDLR